MGEQPKNAQLRRRFDVSYLRSAVHADGRFALRVSQFTQFRTPISHPFFANYPFAVSRFAFRRLLIAYVGLLLLTFELQRSGVEVEVQSNRVHNSYNSQLPRWLSI